MRNVNSILLFVILLFTIASGCSSSCTGGGEGHFESPGVTPEPPRPADEGDTAPEVNGEVSATPQEETVGCQPSERSVCFLGSSYSSIAELELCGGAVLSDITPEEGSNIGSGVSLYVCPQYSTVNADEPTDLVLISKNNNIISVSEAHFYSSISRLASAGSAISALYNSRCRTVVSQHLPELFSCEIYDSTVFVAIAMSSGDEGHVMIISFISDLDSFTDLIGIL